MLANAYNRLPNWPPAELPKSVNIRTYTPSGWAHGAGDAVKVVGIAAGPQEWVTPTSDYDRLHHQLLQRGYRLVASDWASSRKVYYGGRPMYKTRLHTYELRGLAPAPTTAWHLEEVRAPITKSTYITILGHTVRIVRYNRPEKAKSRDYDQRRLTDASNQRLGRVLGLAQWERGFDMSTSREGVELTPWLSFEPKPVIVEEPPVKEGDTQPVAPAKPEPPKDEPPVKPIRKPTEDDTIPGDGKWWGRDAEAIRKGHWLKLNGAEVKVLKVRRERVGIKLFVYYTRYDGQPGGSVAYWPNQRVWLKREPEEA